MVDQIRPEVTILSAVNMQVGGAAFGVDRSGNRLSVGIVISPVGQAHCEVTGKIRRNDGPREGNFLAGEAHEKIDCSRRPLENLLPSANVVFLICDLFLDRKRCVERNTMVGAIIGVGKCPIFRYKDGVLMKSDTFQISHSIQFIQAGSFESCKSLLTQVQSKKASLSIFNIGAADVSRGHIGADNVIVLAKNNNLVIMAAIIFCFLPTTMRTQRFQGPALGKETAERT